MSTPATHRLRPEATLELLRDLSRSLQAPRPRARMPRLAVVAALSAVLATALGATGGLSYAASSLAGAAKVAKRVEVRSSGSDQYEPGYGFGDPDHNHDGPPGLERDVTAASADAGSLPAEPTPDTEAKLVGTAVTFDEQVHLYISVVDGANRPLLLTQSSKRGGSTVGDQLAGPQTKFIQYALLVPRTIPIRLRVPSNLLLPSAHYRIRIVAFDPQGNRSQLEIPFRG